MKNNIKVWFVILAMVYSITPFAQQPQPEIKVQTNHSSFNFVSYSPDGKYAVSAGFDKTVNLWDISSGKEIRTFTDLTSNALSVCFTPDGKYILSSSYDYSKLWEISTGKVIRTFEGFASLSPNGKYVLTAGRQSQHSPKGKIVITGDGLWDISSGEKIKTLISMYGCFSPDGRYVISANGEKIKICDVKTGELTIFSGQHSQMVNSVCVSPNGSFALSGSSDKTVAIWDISTGKVIRKFLGHTGRVSSVSFSPDGNYALSLSDDKTAKLWVISSGKEIQTFPGAFSACFSPNGNYLLLAGLDCSLKLWDISTGNAVKTFSGNSDFVKSVKFSSDGKYIIQAMLVTFNPWDLVLKLEPPYKHFNGAGQIDSPDYKFTFDDGGFHPIQLSEISTDKVIQNSFGLKGRRPVVYCFSPDSKYLVLCGGYYMDKTIKKDFYIKLWETSTGKELKTFSDSKNLVSSMCVSPDSKFLLFSAGNVKQTACDLTLMEISTGRKVKTFSGHTNVVMSVCFSPDGKYALSGSSDGALKLWDISSGKELRTFSSHSTTINSVCFSPDGKYAVSGSDDNTVKLWDIPNRNLIYTYFTNRQTGQWFAWDKDGYWDASPNGGSLVAMVQGMEVWNIDQFAVKNNRPDKILARLAETPPELIKHYYNQYLKRLKKLNLSEANLSQSLETPEINITKTIQNGKKVTVNFTITSKTAKVTHYSIFVNDVPIFGTYGKEITNTDKIDSKSLVLSETIELTSGSNKIEISAMNENGAESFRAPTVVSYNPVSPIRPDLYYLGFGVSKYKKAELNLQFADKDAKDLATVFEKMKYPDMDTNFEEMKISEIGSNLEELQTLGQFANVYTKTYLNSEVTPASIKSAKDFIKNAKPDDTFILFIAGHGTHDTDEEATYYYLTSNADPKNLKNTAADFESIEDLLQGIAPRNKLFLMDACESGEIDDEDQGQMITAATGFGISSRGFKKSTSVNASEAKQSQTTTKRTYLYQKNRYIYNDLVRRSGAIVFSSSKGGELSYERSDIKNGLFTFYIMKALTSKETDKNNDGIISTDELRDYVSTAVGKASGDLQHPVVDRDNIYQKFGFPIFK